MDTAHAMIRSATEQDLDQILALNLRHEQYLSALTAGRLRQLHAMAALHCVAVRDGRIGAFLLAFGQAAPYDSVNFLWFRARYPRFLYIDRIVVAAALQGQGLGRLLYENLFAFAARTGEEFIACEYDIEPPNAASAGFHRRLGFGQVGCQRVAGGAKAVSLQLRRVHADGQRPCAG